MVSRSLPKTSVKSTPQLASILEPIWFHFGRVLGAKLAPNRSQSRCTKISTKMITFWIALGSNFHGFWPPFGNQDGAQNPHLGTKIGPRPPKVGVKIGSKPQLGAKMAPRPSQDHFRGLILKDFGLHFGRFFNDFWRILMIIFVVVFFILAPILLPFCIHFYVSSWLPDHTTVCLSSHWSPKAGGGGDSPKALQ